MRKLNEVEFEKIKTNLYNLIDFNNLSYENSNKIISEVYQNLNSIKEIDCKILTEIFNNLKENITDKKCIEYSNNFNPKLARLIVGHCPQYYYSNTIMERNVIPYKYTDNNRDVFYGNPIKSSTIDNIQDYKTDPGITLDCKLLGEYRLFKVDCGVSRGFDNNNYDYINRIWNIINKTNLSEENKAKRTIDRLYMTRTPQLLCFDQDNTYIYKSTIKNTKIHLPRKIFNGNKIKSKIYSMDKIDPNFTKASNLINNNDPYFKKYFKYKLKYIKLTNNNLNNNNEN